MYPLPKKPFTLFNTELSTNTLYTLQIKEDAKSKINIHDEKDNIILPLGAMNDYEGKHIFFTTSDAYQEINPNDNCTTCYTIRDNAMFSSKPHIEVSEYLQYFEFATFDRNYKKYDFSNHNMRVGGNGRRKSRKTNGHRKSRKTNRHRKSRKTNRKK